MSKRLYRFKERGQTLVEVLGIAVTVLVVLLVIMWAVDKFRAQETKVSAPSSLTWSQGQPMNKPSATDALPGSNDTFNAVPHSTQSIQEEKDDEGDGSGSFKSPKPAATSNTATTTSSQNANNGQQSGAAASGANQSAALAAGKPKAKTDPVMDLNSANATMEAELMAKMMRRSHDAHQLGLDQDDASAPLTDKNKKDDETILIPGVSSKRDDQ